MKVSVTIMKVISLGGVSDFRRGYRFPTVLKKVISNNKNL